MGRIRKILGFLTSYVPFWKDKDVPGVANQIRKTQLKQDQQVRKTDMVELLRMIQEGRLHEADERQLESIKMALELNSLLGEKQASPSGVDSTALVEAVKQAISEGMANVTVNTAVVGEGVSDPSRPQMRHTSLADLVQDDTKVDISHIGEVSTEVEGTQSDNKLEKLRRLKRPSK